MLETLDYTIRIGSTPTILYFDLYLYSAYAAHYVYCPSVIYPTPDDFTCQGRVSGRQRVKLLKLLFLGTNTMPE